MEFNMADNNGEEASPNKAGSDNIGAP